MPRKRRPTVEIVPQSNVTLPELADTVSTNGVLLSALLLRRDPALRDRVLYVMREMRENARIKQPDLQDAYDRAIAIIESLSV